MSTNEEIVIHLDLVEAPVDRVRYRCNHYLRPYSKETH
jgi:hypothetical protein